jgi:hypothetical protein
MRSFANSSIINLQFSLFNIKFPPHPTYRESDQVLFKPGVNAVTHVIQKLTDFANLGCRQLHPTATKEPDIIIFNGLKILAKSDWPMA